MQTNDIIGTGDAGETFTMLGQVPINYQFVNTHDDFDDFEQDDDESEKIEVSSDVPLDTKFIHIET